MFQQQWQGGPLRLITKDTGTLSESSGKYRGRGIARILCKRNHNGALHFGKAETLFWDIARRMETKNCTDLVFNDKVMWSYSRGGVAVVQRKTSGSLKSRQLPQPRCKIVSDFCSGSRRPGRNWLWLPN
jgi:hypothetical protein